MTLAVVHSRALDGLAAPEVTVEVHLANGLPAFTLVGLADTEVKEARERVRAALQNSGLAFPHNKRIKCSQATSYEPVSGRSDELALSFGRVAGRGPGRVESLWITCRHHATIRGNGQAISPHRGSQPDALASA